MVLLFCQGPVFVLGWGCAWCGRCVAAAGVLLLSEAENSGGLMIRQRDARSAGGLWRGNNEGAATRTQALLNMCVGRVWSVVNLVGACVFA